MRRKQKGLKKKWWEVRFDFDTDNDDVPDYKDCEWWNPEKQDRPHPDRRPMPMPIPMPLVGKKKRKWF